MQYESRGYLDQYAPVLLSFFKKYGTSKQRNKRISKAGRGVRVNIAIIGAGISAAAAAKILLAQGASVSVFEKARGPGGRLSSKRALAGSFDFGAQYFTARTEAFKHQVQLWLQTGVSAALAFYPLSVSARELESFFG